MHADFELLLRRYAVEAAAAGVTGDTNEAEAVAGVLADAFESGEGALVVDVSFKVFGLLTETLLVLTGFGSRFR